MGASYCSVLLLGILALSSTVRAGDIIFYSSTTACMGSGVLCASSSDSRCCKAKAGSVQFINSNSCQRNYVFANTYCASPPAQVGVDNLCFTGRGFKSAFWLYLCKRRSLLTLSDQHQPDVKCKGDIQPSALVFTQDPAQGTWILDTPQAVDMLGYLESLADDDKISWLQGQGARFESASETEGTG